MRETYRGVRLEARKGRQFGHVRWIINGREWGEWIGRDYGDELRKMRGYVDLAGERPDAFDPMWHPCEMAS